MLTLVCLVRARLKEDRLNETEKFISVWYRAGKHAPLVEMRSKFPRKAAMAFSEVWRKQLEGGAGVVIIDDVDKEPYNRILDWIEICIDEGNDVKFPEVRHDSTAHPAPEALCVYRSEYSLQVFPQIEDKNPIHVALDVIAAANYIQVPPMSLQEHLKKDAARKYARKELISLEYVERIYDPNNSDSFGENEVVLQEAAAASIFEAWWAGKLDDPYYDEYCMYLGQMRAEFPKLDEDINARYKDKVEFKQKQREERRAGKSNGNTGNGAVDGAADGGYGPADGQDGGWGDAAVGTEQNGTGEWGAGSGGGTGDWGNSGGW